MGHVTWTRPLEGWFVICRLGLAMFNSHTKFEVSIITCKEEIKGNAKCKNSCFEPPFGGLRGNAQGSSMARRKAHCRLPISDNWTFFASCHGCGTIKRNLSKSAFSEGVCQFERKFIVDVDVARYPSMDRSIEEWCSYNLAAGSFHIKRL